MVSQEELRKDSESLPDNSPHEAAGMAFQGAPVEVAGVGAWLKQQAWEILLFLTNHVVNRIPSHALRLWFYRKVWGWEIGRDTSIHMGLELLGGKGLVTIGDNTVIGRHVYMAGVGMGELRIGSNVLIAPHVHFALGHHDPITMRNILATTVVDDNAIIYLRATILPGVHIGEGVIVSAGAVVASDVAPYKIAIGNPARVIAERPKEVRYRARWFWRYH
jgi:maltose O-acetyltransferase